MCQAASRGCKRTGIAQALPVEEWTAQADSLVRRFTAALEACEIGSLGANENAAFCIRLAGVRDEAIGSHVHEALIGTHTEEDLGRLRERARAQAMRLDLLPRKRGRYCLEGTAAVRLPLGGVEVVVVTDGWGRRADLAFSLIWAELVQSDKGTRRRCKRIAEKAANPYWARLREKILQG